MRFSEGQSLVALELVPAAKGLSKRYVAVEVTHTLGREIRFVVRDIERAWSVLGTFGACIVSNQLRPPTYSITNGSMMLLEGWRGLHIGSWCQNHVVSWTKQLPPGRVKSIWLSPSDARSSDARERRNRFYEQFGIPFVWKDIGGHPFTEGHSPDTFTSDQLRTLDAVPGVVAHNLPMLLGRMLWDVERLTRERDGLKMALDRERQCHRETHTHKVRGLTLAAAAITVAIAAVTTHF